MLKKIIDAGLSPPRDLTFAITNSCNLECSHCWPESAGTASAGHIVFELFKRIVLGFSSYGIDKIIITGGEPLLHPEWLRFVSFSCELEGIKEVCLQTNATLINADVVDSLLCAGVEKISVQVSLDGGTAKTNDLVRGDGAFRKTLTGLRLLAESDLRSRVHVNFTEFRHNFNDIPFLLGFLKNLGISRFTSSTLIKAGRASRSDFLKIPVGSQYCELLKLYKINSRFKKIYDEIGNISAIEWYKGKNCYSRRGCEIFKKPYISADLKLFPCVFLPIDKYASYLIKTDNLHNVLSIYLPMWTELQKISLSRLEKLKNCHSCPGFNHCATGCMGRAIAKYGTYFAREDRCSLRKAIYKENFAQYEIKTL